MDPQQRLLLEVAWEALENAAFAADQLMGSATGVFVGICNSDITIACCTRRRAIDAYLASGNAPSVAAGRISYILGLQGPALRSTRRARRRWSRSIWPARACAAANAAGPGGRRQLIFSPETTIALSQGADAGAGRSLQDFRRRGRRFRARRGLRRGRPEALTDAFADGDRSCRHPRHGRQPGRPQRRPDRSQRPGAGSRDPRGLATPASSPAEIGYVEAHGTGTSLGDPIEVHASAVFGRRAAADGPLLVGSVKTNLGHLEAAAGIAGLIKTVLALQHGSIPPHLHFQTLNPHIPGRSTSAVTSTTPPGRQDGRGSPASARSGSAARTRMP